MRNKFPTIHGLRKHPLYKTWNRMLARCNDPKDVDYKNYGGRGIKVCDAWFNIHAFILDVGERPHNHTLDRIDNNGNYEPTNVRWATRKQQNANKRKQG